MSDGRPSIWLIFAAVMAGFVALAQCQPPATGPNCRDLDPTAFRDIYCEEP